MAARIRSNSPLAKLKSEADELLLSPDDVDTHLKAMESFFALSGLGIKVSHQETVHEWGNCDGREAVSGKLGDNGANVSIYLSNDSDFTKFELQQALHSLLEAFKIAWAKEYRNEHGGLTLKASGAEDSLLASIRHRCENLVPKNFCVIYIDVDHFKPINDQCGHAEGDKALRVVYAEMHKLARNLKGYAFFDGGDEFILVFPTEDVLEISSGLWKLLKAIRAKKFGKEELQISFTAGVVIRSGAEISSNFQKIKSTCESLTKKGVEEKIKRRGTISFETSHSSTLPQNEKEVTLESFYKLGVSLSRCRQPNNHPFKDERLNLIIDQVIEHYESYRADVNADSAVSAITAWFGSSLTSSVLESNLLHAVNTYETISKHSIAVAVAHGLAGALARQEVSSGDVITIRWSNDASQAMVAHNGRKFWGDDLPDMNEILYGPPVKKTGLESTGLFAGVQIGFDEKPKTPGGNRLPADFLVDQVRVDVRPQSGGGLPDFWQVALAQIVSCLGKDTNNIIKVLIWGEDVSLSETYIRLSNPESWSNDEIAHLTGLDSEKIRSVGTSIKNKIIVTSSASEMLDEIYDGYQGTVEFLPSEISESGEKNDALPRPMATTTPLSQSEGAVCTTAAMAYPIIIDTLRKSQDIRLSTDDAEQEQRELIAFKLKLTSPLTNPIPHYLKKQEAELDVYAKKVLLDVGGLIRSSLEETNQVSAFVQHLSTYVGHKTKTRSTRRACMVVQHIPKDDNTPKPWGLISVWATPRYSDSGATYLDYVFVWRTVEAFIGLPYSLYGSIKLAEQLVNQICEQISKQEGNSNIYLGELNYIALSLHIGSDEFHSRVAKHIVDLASD